MENIIEVERLTKRFGMFEAVKGIDFQVKRGSLFALLGTNGAGKSTTIEILCTLQEKTSGKVLMNGQLLGTAKSNERIRKAIGVVFQQSLLDEQLTVRENIWHRGMFYRLTKKQLIENYEFVRESLKLGEIENVKYGRLSGGQKRRADIARAIIHKPEILFLDEPTTGLDPKTRKFVWQVIDQLRKEKNMTVFLTTHYMEEAALADDIAIMKEGKIIARGSPQFLKEKYAKDQLILLLKDGGEERLKELSIHYKKRAEAYVIPVKSTLEALPILEKVKDDISSFEVIKGTLDDIFLEVNGGGDQDVCQLSAAQL